MTRLAAVFALLAALLAADQPYRAEVEAWRSQREADLRGEGGWLSVAGLFWLKEGPNRFGSAKENAIVLPAGSAPPVAGTLELRGGKVTARIEPGVEVTTEGKPVSVLELRPDTTAAPDVLKVGRLTLHVIVRGDRVGVRLKDPEAPTRRQFTGLRWFPVKDEYRVSGRFVAHPGPLTIAVPNILGQVIEMPSPGYVTFTLQDRELRLDPVLEEPGAKELFFIFRDETAGHESYPAGRFLYTALPRDGAVMLDFNKAYSPPCAFTAFATCPLPPKQNRLPVRVEAGEMYTGHH
ncbi:MAG TPA: DUF1684 domain-containing protein [Vicinamibacteria bacterium]